MPNPKPGSIWYQLCVPPDSALVAATCAGCREAFKPKSHEEAFCKKCEKKGKEGSENK